MVERSISSTSFTSRNRLPSIGRSDSTTSMVSNYSKSSFLSRTSSFSSCPISRSKVAASRSICPERHDSKSSRSDQKIVDSSRFGRPTKYNGQKFQYDYSSPNVQSKIFRYLQFFKLKCKSQ